MTSFHSTTTPPDAEGQATCFVLGGKHRALAIAERLHADGRAVTVVDEAYDSAEVPGVEGSPTDLELLSGSGLEAASTVIVGTRSDARNFLIAQLVEVHFDIPRIIVLVNDPDRHSPLAEAGHEPFCVTTALSETVRERI